MAGRGVNDVTLIGNLGKDPEMKYLDNGTAIARMTLATSESWNDANGDKQERTTWHNLTAFGKLAEICEQYLQKGRQVYVRGSIENREYEDENGEKRYYSGIKVRELTMLGGRGDDADSQADEQQPEAKKPSSKDDLPF